MANGMHREWNLNWPDAGACDFPHDPDAAPDREPLFWSPRFQPQAVKLVPAEPDETASQPTVVLAHLDGLDLRRAADGWHGIWQADGVEHQFWLSQSVPDAAAFYAVELPLDDFMELRAHAARRFWRSIKGRTPGPDFRNMPAQLRQWHILSLRALDARLLEAAGVSYGVLEEESCWGEGLIHGGGMTETWAIWKLEKVEELEQTLGGDCSRTILTICPHCKDTIGTQYKHLGKHFSGVVSHVSYLAALVESGKLKIEKKAEEMAAHHPCKTIHNDEHGTMDSLLAVDNSAPGYELLQSTHALLPEATEIILAPTESLRVAPQASVTVDGTAVSTTFTEVGHGLWATSVVSGTIDVQVVLEDLAGNVQ